MYRAATAANESQTNFWPNMQRGGDLTSPCPWRGILSTCADSGPLHILGRNSNFVDAGFDTGFFGCTLNQCTCRFHVQVLTRPVSRLAHSSGLADNLERAGSQRDISPGPFPIYGSCSAIPVATALLRHLCTSPCAIPCPLLWALSAPRVSPEGC
jgi:hypothetical protein